MKVVIKYHSYVPLKEKDISLIKVLCVSTNWAILLLAFKAANINARSYWEVLSVLPVSHIIVQGLFVRGKRWTCSLLL